MRKIIMFFLVFALFLLAGCGCEHEWVGHDCDASFTCAQCGDTRPKTPEHKWTEATCQAPQTCVICGATQGEPKGHRFGKWKPVASLNGQVEEMYRVCPACGSREQTAVDWGVIVSQAPFNNTEPKGNFRTEEDPVSADKPVAYGWISFMLVMPLMICAVIVVYLRFGNPEKRKPFVYQNGALMKKHPVIQNFWEIYGPYYDDVKKGIDDSEFMKLVSREQLDKIPDGEGLGTYRRIVFTERDMKGHAWTEALFSCDYMTNGKPLSLYAVCGTGEHGSEGVRLYFKKKEYAYAFLVAKLRSLKDGETKQQGPKKEAKMYCARCKKEITEATAQWLGNHRVCEACAKPLPVSKAAATARKRPAVFPEAQETPAAIQAVYSRNLPGTDMETEQIGGQSTVENRKLYCARCKKEITEATAQWLGNHRVCQACSEPVPFTRFHLEKGLYTFFTLPNLPGENVTSLYLDLYGRGDPQPVLRTDHTDGITTTYEPLRESRFLEILSDAVPGFDPSFRIPAMHTLNLFQVLAEGGFFADLFVIDLRSGKPYRNICWMWGKNAASVDLYIPVSFQEVRQLAPDSSEYKNIDETNYRAILPMTVSEMKDIIAREDLETYNRFYFGTTYVGENCISMEPLPDGQYRVCITGERGRHTKEILPESEACKKVVAYLRNGKKLGLEYGNRWSCDCPRPNQQGEALIKQLLQDISILHPYRYEEFARQFSLIFTGRHPEWKFEYTAQNDMYELQYFERGHIVGGIRGYGEDDFRFQYLEHELYEPVYVHKDREKTENMISKLYPLFQDKTVIENKVKEYADQYHWGEFDYDKMKFVAIASEKGSEGAAKEPLPMKSRSETARQVSEQAITERIRQMRRLGSRQEDTEAYSVPMEAEYVLFQERTAPYDYSVNVGVDLRSLQPYLHISLIWMGRGAVWTTDTYEQLSLEQLKEIVDRVFEGFNAPADGQVLFESTLKSGRLTDRVCIDPCSGQPYRSFRFAGQKDKPAAEVAIALTFPEVSVLAARQPVEDHKKYKAINGDNWREYLTSAAAGPNIKAGETVDGTPVCKSCAAALPGQKTKGDTPVFYRDLENFRMNMHTRSGEKHSFVLTGICMHHPNRCTTNGYGSDDWFFHCKHNGKDHILHFIDSASSGTAWESAAITEADAKNLCVLPCTEWVALAEFKKGNLNSLHPDRIADARRILKCTNTSRGPLSDEDIYGYH